MMSGTVKRLAAVAAIAGAFATGAVVASRAEDAPAGDAVNGKRLYLADGCFECHGRAGQGGRFNYLTPALAQIALPVESFIAFLREAPNDMPSFSADVLSDKDAADIHAYLSSLPGPKAAKDIPPILNQ
ncbi:cytochrome c [Bradyrhizobium sp. B097]|uniref:c-type cytochrome n=1 Tax=Bradyrhizobium sp. B097 TaxID=3140244 RepID=UPI003183C502